ncbi:unnamed protein product [Schistocephalus solidus]|uniref:FGGY_C domain-containing protein n=1 Tax=Schistocephalus solidus TaxID=70667 RepID=A0A183SGN7_SCHSO|nr:unnamed protein product [Schistocephalus solidus]
MSCWYDTSASAFAAALNQSRFVESINKSGRILYKALPTTKFKIISNYSLTGIFACTRLAHLFAENPELERRCLKGEFIFGCLETWLLWRLTGGRAWCTDVSCTSASGMFDPCTLASGEYHVDCSSVSSEAILAFREQSSLQVSVQAIEENAGEDLSGAVQQRDSSVVVAEVAVPERLALMEELCELLHQLGFAMLENLNRDRFRARCLLAGELLQAEMESPYPELPQSFSTNTSLDMSHETFKACKTYNLGTGRGYTVLELIEAMKAASGKPIKYRVEFRRPGDVSTVYADASLAKKELPWQANLGLPVCPSLAPRVVFCEIKEPTREFYWIIQINCNFGIVRCGPLARDAKARQLGVPPVYVTALIGDSQAAMLGEGCLDKGDTKLTLGTGSFLNCNLGSKTIPPPKGFYPVVGWAISVRDRDSNITCETSPDTKLSNVTYLLEGFNSEGGRTLSRLQRLGLFQNFDDLDDLLSAASSELEFASKSVYQLVQTGAIPDDWNNFLFFCAIARHRKSSNTTVYVPSSLGLKNYRKSKKSERPEVEALEARLLFVNTNSLLTQGGVFVGLPASLLSAPRPASSLSAEESGAILLAVFNALTMASRLMVSKCRGRDFANKLPVLRVNGNLSRSAWLMQRLADTLDVPVERSPLSETCCLGAAVAAGVGAGFWQDYSEALPALHTQKALKEADLSASGIPFKTRFEPNPAIVYPQEQAYCRWLRTCNKILLSQASFTSAEPSDCTNADLSSVPGVAFDVLAKHLA